MWNCSIVGALSDVDAQVRAEVDGVGGVRELDAAVVASSVAGALFKAFGASGASCSAANGKRRVQSVRSDPADLGRYSVDVEFVQPEQRVLVHATVVVAARGLNAASALACARLGRALRGKLEGEDSLEFVDVRVTELEEKKQRHLDDASPSEAGKALAARLEGTALRHRRGRTSAVEDVGGDLRNTGSIP